MKEKIKIGAITIGQSPRKDLTPEIQDMLGKRFTIIERGALDNYNRRQIEKELSPENGHDLLVSRLRDNSEVQFSKKRIMPLVQNCIDELEQRRVEVILMLCTGEFSSLCHKALLIEPQKIIHSLLSRLIRESLGVLVPAPEQADQIKERLKKLDLEVEIQTASPYKDLEKFAAAISELDKTNAEMILLDCMGYNIQMKKRAAQLTGKNILLPRTIICALLKELF